MRNGTRDRRSLPSASASASTSPGCVVCGSTDARVLSFTRLSEGERVTVCGSHKTAHQRSEKIATTVDELKTLTADRRAS